MFRPLPHLQPRLPRPLKRSQRLGLPAAHPCLAALLLLLPLAGLRPRPVETAPVAVLTPSPVREAVEESRREEGPAIYQLTPERRALLSTIRFAEGTWLGGSREGYRVLYGGGRFEDLTRHPEIEVRKRYVSAAAGAYQFLPQTWKAAARELGLPDFGPASQDQAALHLVRKRGALQSFDREGLSAGVLARLAHEWASLPSLGGGSVYGQPVRSAEELQAFFRRELERQRELRSA